MMFTLLHIQIFIEDWWGSDTDELTALQMMLRAIVTFLLALLIIRIAGIRSFGSKSAFDIVLSITVGAVMSRCITGHYSYLACAGAATILALMHRLFAIFSFRNSFLSYLIKGKPHVLLSKNKINWTNMKRHHLSMDDLIQALHKKGFLNLDEIEEAFFETNGKISLIPKAKKILPI
jgi:uncharacterized membrane protein YcaP (DUF421 family)